MNEKLASVCKNRQKALVQSIPHEKAIIVMQGNQYMTRSMDTCYPFKQDNDFYYLTGCCIPHAILVLLKSKDSFKSILFMMEEKPPRPYLFLLALNLEKACKTFHMDEVYPIGDFHEKIIAYLKKEAYRHIYHKMSHQPFLQLLKHHDFERCRNQTYALLSMHNILPYMDQLRVIKDAYEFEILKKASQITTEAFLYASSRIQPNMPEYQISALFTYIYEKNNATHAYSPIVAGGDNGIIWHYQENNQMLKAGDTLLIDAGCEYESYASDVTRVYPIGGRFSQEQRAIYKLVLEIQKEIISSIVIGTTTYQSLSYMQHRLSWEGLKSLGIITDKKFIDPILQHGLGHSLGLDVHDVMFDHTKPLQNGMVFTIEPGIYIPRNIPEIEERWHGVSTRVEDTLCCFDGKVHNLTEGIPKEISDIEKSTL